MQVSKTSIFFLMLMVVLVVLASAYAMRVREVEDDAETPWQYDEMTIYNETEPPTETPERTIETKSFSMAEGLEIPSVVNQYYPIYTISFTEFINETANEIINSLFGNITAVTVEFKQYEDFGFDYWVIGGIYGIKPRDTYFYFNHSPSSQYTEDEIASNASLFNGTECKSISDEYIMDRLGDASALFTYVKTSQSRSYSNDGIFIKHYSFRYPRRLESLTVYDEEAGKVLTWVSPNGTFLSFTMYMPVLEKNGISLPIDPLEAIRRVDGNFTAFRYYLPAGQSTFTLSRIELGYGKVEDRLVIGWILYFDSNDLEASDSSVFVS